MTTYLQGKTPRRCALFDRDWTFALTDSVDFPGPQTSWQPVLLPHDWSVLTPIRQDSPCGGQGGFFQAGIGWYRKTFTLSHGAQERIELCFDGVYKDCDIWINGQHAGSHGCGYISFTVDVTPFLQPGENECLIRVDNSDQPNSRWYAGSGITRSVYIRATQPTRVREDGLFIVSEPTEAGGAVLRSTLEVEGLCPDLTAEVAVLAPSGEELTRAVLPITANCTDITLTLDRAERWDIDHPAMHEMQLTLIRAGEEMDAVRTRFGIRSLRFDAMEGFFLNDRPVKLNGVCLHHDGGCVGAAVPPAVWRRRFRKLKDMGCNAIRVSHNPPDRAFLDLCDEMGFLVNAELFDEWREVKRKTWNNLVREVSHGYGEHFDACAAADAEAIVRRDRNHPSIILWTAGNEIPEQVREEGIPILRMLMDIIRRTDGTRPITTANDNMHADPASTLPEFMALTDVVGANYIDRWEGYTERFFEPDKLAHPDWIFYGSEHSAPYGWRGDYTGAGETTSWFMAPYASRTLKAERLMKFIQSRPYVLGDFMWTGIDHLGESDWPRKSSVSGVIDTAGFEKDQYYFYQSQYVKDRPVLHLMPWLNLDVEEGTVIPVVAYTNCARVELYVNGKCWGAKRYEFPYQGMKGGWDQFARPLAEITTNDLHLTWDVPYQEGVIEAVGYDPYGREIARAKLQTAGSPACLLVEADAHKLQAATREVIQLEMTLLDDQGVLVPHQDVDVTAHIEGPLRLLGMDNGNGACHIPFDSPTRPTGYGRLYLIAEATETGKASITLTAPNLPAATVEVECI